MGRVLERTQATGISARPTVYSRDDLSDVLHYHETAYLTFVLEGAVTEKRRSVENECIPGTLTFFHAGEPHECVNEAERTKSINFELTDRFFDRNHLTETLLASAITSDPNAKFTMLKIYNELLVKDEFTEQSVEMLLVGVSSAAGRVGSKRPMWVDNVKCYLNDNWNADFTLADLATASGVHRITISKHFSRYFGCTFGEYRRRLRVEKALNLIRTSRHSLTDVALDCGFYDQSHFTRTFKSLTGLLPKQYGSL